MKRMTLIVMALAMVLGFTQCKKEQPVPQNENQAEGVRITLTVDGGNNNSRVIVDPTGHTNPNYATVTFEAGDVIYVGNNGAYCGYLEYNGSTSKFEGSVEPTSMADYLHFYFMGNKGAKSVPTSVSITDQTSKYPVISYAHSKTLYSGAGAYSAKLQNYCAIAKFPLSGSGTNNDVYVRGLYNTVTVDFAANNYANSTTGSPYSFSKEGNGTIKLHSESATEKWAILLEQAAVTADLLADGFEATTVSVPAIESNTYHASDIAATSLTAGSKVCYAFTVDNKGSVVRFSKGNLQYKSGTGWRLAENQYNYIGGWNTSSWVDLFGWGTWGDGKNPLLTTQTYYEYAWSTDFQGTIDGHNDWRTLTRSEWQYLFNNNTYGKATVNNIHGVIIVPNGSSLSINTSHNSWDNNIINIASTWTSTYEAAGAVFLPAAGYREDTGMNELGNNGCYWSSTPADVSTAYEVDFMGDYLDLWDARRAYGMSVRLVR